MEREGRERGGQRPDAEPGDERLDEGEDGLWCAACGALVTRAEASIEVAGTHEHVRMNPAGFVFTLRCFSTAPGAREVGPSSSEFAWFPHYDWRIAVCGACGTHLGWWFASSGHRFAGLVREALVESGPRGSGVG